MRKTLVALVCVVAIVVAGASWKFVAAAESKTKLTTQDYFDIYNLYGIYTRYTDMGYGDDGTNYASMFTPDGIFNNRIGREANKIAIHNQQGGWVRDNRSVRHTTTNIVVTPTADGVVKGSAYLLVFNVAAVPPFVEDSGIYEDWLVKTTEGWRFKKRLYRRSPTFSPGMPQGSPELYSYMKGAPGPEPSAPQGGQRVGRASAAPAPAALPLEPGAVQADVTRALLAAPANLAAEATVVKWKSDFTYDTLRKGTNRLACYDISGLPTQPAFSTVCTSIANLPRVAQNLKIDAMGDQREAAFAAAEKDGTRVKPEYGSIWYHLMGPTRWGSRPHVTTSVPGATTKTIGLPENGSGGGMWIMNAGTTSAHLMTPGDTPAAR
jgi:hypothetical protein